MKYNSFGDVTALHLRRIGQQLLNLYKSGKEKIMSEQKTAMNKETARKFYERCGLVPQKYGMETIL